MDDNGNWGLAATATSYQTMVHRQRSAAGGVCRLVPLAVALLLTVLFALWVVVPVAQQWRAEAGTVLVDP